MPVKPAKDASTLWLCSTSGHTHSQTETASDDLMQQTQCWSPSWAEWGQCVRSSGRARPPRARQQRWVQSQTEHSLRLSLALCYRSQTNLMHQFMVQMQIADGAAAAVKTWGKWGQFGNRDIRSAWFIDAVTKTCYSDMTKTWWPAFVENRVTRWKSNMFHKLSTVHVVHDLL